ncbi:MAG: sulfurtransferase [Methanotrichaceae archaeon]
MKPTKLQYWLLGTFAVLIALTILVCGTHIQNNSSLIGMGNITSERSDELEKMLIPISDVSSSDTLLDISQNPTKHINGSVVIPYTMFILGGGLLKPVPEIAQILGDAGISREDRVVVYGECMVCGGGPAPATYVYWIMKCLGHKDIRVLNGTADDWAAAGGPISNKSAIRPISNYTTNFTTDLIATYEFVKSNKSQIVDARLPEEFETGTIPGAINLPYDNVLDGHRIKNETGLGKAFINLSKDRPVVVFTDTGVKASVVWFALELMGYDARLYSWQDWLNNQALENSATSQSIS